ncbi:MAG: TRAP transporter large permease [Alphaproteobacteria bacterium]|nr:TRAP transporter large permease [Alphaproteobacteria bacterium]
MSGTLGLVFVALLAIGVPVTVALTLAGVAAIEFHTSVPLLVVIQQFYAALDKFPLVAIPFFILSGNLMQESGISGRLVEFARAVVGRMQGGLAVSCVLTCMIFAAVSGSSVATTFAIGTVLIPAMVRAGYPVAHAAALQAASAELGIIIPPSIPMILYGVSADVSIAELFVAGFGPGLLIAAALSVWLVFWCRRKGHGMRDGENRLPLGIAARNAWTALLMPLIVLGGIYGGVFTPTEASAVAVMYALVVGVAIDRTLDWGGIVRALRASAMSTSIIMLIIAPAGLFAFLITRSGAANGLAALIGQLIGTDWQFLLLVNVLLFLLGMFVDAGAMILVLAPILTPIAQGFGIDPVHFGLIMVVSAALGMITPPFAVNLFAVCSVANLSYDRVIRPILPFVAIVSLCQLTITFVPAISLALRDLVFR